MDKCPDENADTALANKAFCKYMAIMRCSLILGPADVVLFHAKTMKPEPIKLKKLSRESIRLARKHIKNLASAGIDYEKTTRTRNRSYRRPGRTGKHKL